MLIVHIGRGKSGSTAIQAGLEKSRAELAASGYYIPTTKMREHHVEFGRQLMGKSSGSDTLDDIRQALRVDSKRVLISNEFMFTMEAGSIAKLLHIASDRELKIIAYIRDYVTWLPSLYSQYTTTGRNSEGFDKFFRFKRLSALPNLRTWGDGVGWENLSIRQLSSGRVDGVPLLQDFSNFIGVDLKEARASNASPHWWAIEFSRAVTVLHPNLDAEEAAHFTGAMKRLNRIALATNAPKAPYLTAAQIAELTARYSDDIAELSRSASRPIVPATPPNVAPRAFCPSLAHVPLSVLENLLTLCRRRWGPGSPATAKLEDVIARREELA